MAKHDPNMISPAPPTSPLVGRGGEPQPHVDRAAEAHQSGGPGGGRDERRLGAHFIRGTLSSRSARPTRCLPRTISETINQGDS